MNNVIYIFSRRHSDLVGSGFCSDYRFFRWVSSERKRTKEEKGEGSRPKPGFWDQYICSEQNGQYLGVLGSPDRSFPQYGQVL